MVLDYKTLQAIAASESGDADGYCPECGQPMDRPIQRSSRHATVGTWWPGILAALGLYLAIAFGIKAQSAQRLAAARFECLRQVASWCTGPGGVEPRCADLAAARGLDPVLARLWRYVAAEREARGAMAVAAAGVLATLAGVAAATRPLSRASKERRASPWLRMLRAAWDILALGATVLLPAAQVLLAASCTLALGRLLWGAPPSADLVAWSVHRTIELVVAVAQNA